MACRIEFKEIGRSRGRAIFVEADGTIHRSDGLTIHRSTDDGRTWIQETVVPCSLKRRVASVSRMASRLLRHEVRAFLKLKNGTLIAANRQNVFYSSPFEPLMTAARIESDGQTPYPPMHLTAGVDGQVIWGEYNSRTRHGNPVRLFVSCDNGRSYQIARVFEGGSIRHVHNIEWDSLFECYWLFAGDEGEEPGIGRLSRDLRQFDWVVKGRQEVRVVDAFDFGQHFIYATDSELEENHLIRFDKRSGRTERLRDFGGSCIYATRFGEFYVLSTTVEPSRVNHVHHATLWISRDAEDWKEVLTAEKDGWSAKYFQYGSIVLPRGRSERNTIFFSGQAVRGWDGIAATATVHFD